MDRLIIGEGIPDATWMRSAQLAAVPCINADHVLANVSRLVVLSPHPDDEVLGVGGVIARARRMGRSVHVLAATDGEACYPGEPRWTQAEIAQVRRRELHDALDILGRGINVHYFELPDGGLTASSDVLHARLVRHVRADDLLLVPWRHDGHPDHEAAANVGLAVAREVGCRCLEYPVWGWHWASPDSNRMPLDRAWRLSMTPDMRERKRLAIDTFVSQIGADPFDVDVPILPPWARRRFERPFEVLFA